MGMKTTIAIRLMKLEVARMLAALKSLEAAKPALR